MVLDWNSIIYLVLVCLMQAQSLHWLNNGEQYHHDIIVKLVISNNSGNEPKKKKCPWQRMTYIHFGICREVTQANSILLKISTDACKGTETEVNYLEHVQAVVTVNATRRGDLEIFLTSPMGTRSMILSKRVNDDDHRDGFTKWPFMTTHTWGEYPQGTWTLEVCFDLQKMCIDCMILLLISI